MKYELCKKFDSIAKMVLAQQRLNVWFDREEDACFIIEGLSLQWIVEAYGSQYKRWMDRTSCGWASTIVDNEDRAVRGQFQIVAKT